MGESRDELIGKLKEEIERRKGELEQLTRTLDILVGKSSEPSWICEAERLVFEFDGAFTMKELSYALSARGFNVRTGTVSSWLSMMYKDKGLLRPEGSKKGLWIANLSS